MENLLLIFKTKAEYERAKDFFDNESDYAPFDQNDEFRSLTFEEGCNIDALEAGISEELEANGFEGYHFETEEA